MSSFDYTLSTNMDKTTLCMKLIADAAEYSVTDNGDGTFTHEFFFKYDNEYPGLADYLDLVSAKFPQ